MMITTYEAAKRLGKSYPLIMQAIRKGRLKAIKIGRDYVLDDTNLTLYDNRYKEPKKIC